MNELIDIKFYSQIKSILESARGQVYKAANSAMILAYWQIGKNIVEQQGGDERADYGARLISELAKRLLMKGTFAICAPSISLSRIGTQCVPN